jgi:ribosomal protein L6P/L9E
MSRVANRIIDLPSGVTVTVAAGAVTVKGAKGSLSLPLGEGVSVVQQDKKLSVKYQGDDRRACAPGATARTWPTWSGRHQGLRAQARAGRRRLSRRRCRARR